MLVNPTETVSAILIKAALKIEQRGWVRFSYDCEAGVCALAAINLAADEHFPNDASRANKAALNAEETFARFIGYEEVAEWNDGEERTKEQVVAALRASAAP